MTRTLLSAAVLALLSACTAQAPAPAADATVDAPPPAMDQPAQDVPPATAPQPDGPTPVPDAGDAALSRFDGYGDMRFGIAAADMPAAWGGELDARGKDDNASCYFMTPKWVSVPAEFAFMVGDGRFVRYGTEAAKLSAPGGGRVGMAKSEIARLYAGRIEERPHKYSDGQYLRIRDSGGGNGVLVFETDGKGADARVTEWRVGVPPQVDFVEGCA